MNGFELVSVWQMARRLPSIISALEISGLALCSKSIRCSDLSINASNYRADKCLFGEKLSVPRLWKLVLTELGMCVPLWSLVKLIEEISFWRIFLIDRLGGALLSDL